MKNYFTLFLCLFAISAHADWYELGAAYLCEKSPQRLTIAATVNSSDVNQTIRKESGFTSFEVGKTKINCHVGKKNLTAEVEIIPPGNGPCGGIGNVSVVILPRKKDGYPIFNDRIFANFCYGNGQENMKVVIEEKAGNEIITTCKANNASCETIQIAR